MAVPSITGSQYYQAVRRHLRPRSDGIWVSDSLLASAFERYAATFGTGARYGSSVPGPMEHRKRLAKRHMGELHLGQPHSAAPIWELASLVDLTQWKWKPPAPPLERSRRGVDYTVTRTRSDAVLAPLRSLFHPRAHGLSEPLLPQDVILSGVAEPLSSVPGDLDMGPPDVIAAALESLPQDISNGTGPTSRFPQFCDSWRQALAEGLFHGEAIGEVLTGVVGALDGTNVGTQHSKAAERLKLLLIEATIDGIAGSGNDKTTSFDYVAWDSALHELSTIQMNTIRVFTKAVAIVPQASTEAVLPGILEYLDSFLNSLGRAVKRPTLIRQTAKMAVPLRHLGQSELRFVLDDGTRRAQMYAGMAGVNYPYIRFSWLLLLARLPGVDEEYLAQACVALEAGQADRLLTKRETCQLFLVLAHSQAPLEQYQKLHKTLKYDDTQCYRRLGAQLRKTGQCYRARDLVKFLHAISRETDVTLLARGVSGPRRRGHRTLARMALGMRMPRAAINIACLYEESRRRASPFWESSFGFKALEILIWTPHLDYVRLWRGLGILTGKKFRLQRQRGKLKGISRVEITKITAVGVVIGLSPHLTRRKAFTLLTLCSLNMRRHNAKLPPSFLRVLVYYVTRQLADGEPGITSRIRYVLYIIQRQVGRAEASRIALAIQRRRRANLGLE